MVKTQKRVTDFKTYKLQTDGKQIRLTLSYSSAAAGQSLFWWGSVGFNNFQVYWKINGPMRIVHY